MCNQFAVNVPYLKSLKKSANISTKPMLIELIDSNSLLYLFSSLDQDIILEIITKENLITQRKVNLSFGQNILKIKENVKLVKTIRVKYSNGKRVDEINFL